MTNDKSILVLLVLFLFLIISRFGVECWETIYEEDDLEFERRLKILNKPPVKTIQSKNGDLFDCIDIYNQPAFDHPLLKDHKLQKWPSSIPKRMRNDRSLIKKHSDYKYNRTCPLGTVIIRRTKKEDLINANHLVKSLKRYHTEDSNQLPEHGTIYAALKTNPGGYYGGHARMSVYGLPNLKGNQSSISQIWVVGGTSRPEDKVNAVQAGWHVTPFVHHGDSKTYFFTFWTADNYKSTGCINLLCPGFVMTGGTIGPGSEISDLSVFGGNQRSIEITIFKDKDTGNWWLAHEKGAFVGYWPKELFNSLYVADEIDWGGSAFSAPNEPSPPMCSGHLPDRDLSRTCTFTHMEVVDEKNTFKKPTSVIIKRDNPYYYDIENEDSSDENGYMIRYGGPGASKP